MIKHIRSLYQFIQTSSAVDKLKDWNEVEARIKGQMPLRLLSCVQLASKLSSHCKVRSEGPSLVPRKLEEKRQT